MLPLAPFQRQGIYVANDEREPKKQMLKVITEEKTNPGDISSLQVGWELNVTQLEQATHASKLQLIQSERVSLSSMTYQVSVDQRVVTKPGYINFGLPATNTTAIWVDNHPVTADRLMLFPGDEEATSITQSGFSATAFHLKRDHLEVILEKVCQRSLDELLTHTGVNQLQTADQAALSEELNRWSHLATDQQIATDRRLQQREDTLVELIVDSLFRTKDVARPKQLKSERAMNIALAFIHDTPMDEVTVTMLCDVAGCGISALEYSFKRRFGITPKQYIKNLQLSRMRDALIRFDDHDYKSIADLANQQGFWHMGQFARDYRRLFCELPSQTLARYRR